MDIEGDTDTRPGELLLANAAVVDTGVSPRRGQRLLVVDDDEYVRHLLASALGISGFVMEVCEDGHAALDRVEAFAPALILLDVMMPGIDGFDVCRRLRASGNETPVIFLTARDAREDKVIGLTQGGDDYVTKPFDLDELVARIDAVLKRTANGDAVARRHEYGGIVIDDDAHRVWSDSTLVPLSPTEYKLLRYLLVNAERVVSKAQIINHVWGYEYDGNAGVVETYIFYLRRKLGDAGTRLVQTVRGVGYTLRREQRVVFKRLRRTTTDRRRVFAAVTVLTIVTIAIVEILTITTARTQMMRRTDASLRAQAATTAEITRSLSPALLVQLSGVYTRVIKPENSVTVIAGGKTFFSLPVRDSATPSRPILPAEAVLIARNGQPFTTRGTGGVRRFRVITETDRGITLAFGAPLTTVDRTVADLERSALLLSALAVALLGLLIWRLLAAATKPVDAMIDVATRIGDGDFTARVGPDATYGDAARLGSALNQMTDRIERAFDDKTRSEETLRQFVADASHELRTPLTSIRGYAQLLRMGATGDEAALGIARIESEATRMSTLVDDLLLLARLDEGRPQENEPIDVVAVVAEVAADARVVEPGRPLRLEVPDDPVIVLGGDGRLRQLFTNLLGNVRRYTDSSTECTVSVVATRTDVTVTVADRGPGMSEADAARAFDRFYRADPSRGRDSGGTGLGLAIAKAIAEAHDGTITLATAPGAGVTITVRLPRTQLGVEPERSVSRDGASRVAPTARP